MRIKTYIFLSLTIILFAGCSAFKNTPQGDVHHVVLCWLKDSGNAADRRSIKEVSRTFREIPGVLDVRVGEVLKSDRAIVDDSFDVAITLRFADSKSLATYIDHPIHQKAKKEILLPLVSKVVVYDFVE